MAVGHKVEDSLPNQAVALLDYTRRLDRHRTGRRAVYMHLSKLRPYNRREQHLRIAYNTLETLVQAHEGQIFALANADVVLLCKGATVADMDAVILKVRFLFNEDPLVMGDDGDAKKRFCDWFDLEQDYPTFLAHVENLLAALAAEERRRSSDNERQTARREPPLQTLDPRELARIQDALTRADLSAVMRRQAVCILVGDQPPQLVYNEVFVSIADLQQVIAPKTNLTSNRWLFQYLTETLDKRLLALLPRIDDSSIASRFALNLNVASVLSPQFLAFDTSLRAGTRGTVVIELQTVDVFADLATFRFAREFLRDRGYRLCLDGLNHHTIEFIDRNNLGLDLVKIFWTPEMPDDLQGERLQRLKEAIQTAGAARVILGRCDTPEAVKYGQSLGIVMFQGWHIDSLYNAAIKKPGDITWRQAGGRNP